MKTRFLSLFALVLSVSFSVAAEPTAPAESLQIEIMIFSGRPNPVFIVDDPAEIRDILGTVRSLPQTPAALAKDSSASAPVLGYRGITVRNLSRTASDVKSLVVNRSSVKVTRDNLASTKANSTTNAAAADNLAMTEIRTDSATSLENKLLELARRRGAIDPNLVAAINSQR